LPKKKNKNIPITHRDYSNKKMSADLSIYLVFTAAQLMSLDGASTEQYADAKFIQAVAMVESGFNYKAVGDRRLARGAWQLHFAAWQEGAEYIKKRNGRAWRWGEWQSEEAQRDIAYGYIKKCQQRLVDGGVSNPTPQQLYLCFAMGYSDFKKINFDPDLAPLQKKDAAERVENIFKL